MLVLNVHGAGHTAFDQARKAHEGKPGVVFLTIEDAADAEGLPIQVGDGRPNPRAANRKAMPTPKVRKGGGGERGAGGGGGGAEDGRGGLFGRALAY